MKLFPVNRIVLLLSLFLVSIDLCSQTLQNVIKLGKAASENETGYMVVYNPETNQFCFTISELKNVYRYYTDTNLKVESGYVHKFNKSANGYYATPIAYDLFDQGRTITASILHSAVSTSSGDLSFYIRDFNHFLFTENGIDGKDWKLSQELKLAKKERVLSVFKDEGAFFIVTFRFDENQGFFVYTKEWGKPLEVKKYICNFKNDADNGKSWPLDNNSFQTIFSVFVDYDRTFIDGEVLNNGERYSYAMMQDYYKCYYNNGKVNILVNTSQDASILFSLDLKSGRSTNVVFGYDKRSFEKDALVLSNYNQLQQYAYLNMIISNQCNMIDSTVVIARRMENALQLMYYHAYTGKLLKAEILDKNDIWKPGSIKAIDSLYDIGASSYSSALFYNFLKSSRPSVNLELTDSLTVLMSIEVRDENDAFFKRMSKVLSTVSPDAFHWRYGGGLFKSDYRDFYSERKVLSFSRQLSRRDFLTIDKEITLPLGRDLGIKVQAFIKEKNCSVDDVNVREFNGRFDLIYFNRAEGSIELYRF
jgi:hypothetical protein